MNGVYPRSSRLIRVLLAFALFVGIAACSPTAPTEPARKVLATETFLADIAQNIAGSRLKVDALVPIDVDPHSFEPAPGDIKKVADSTVIIINGTGLEAFLDKLLKNAGGKRLVIEASAGLKPRTPREGEVVDNDHPQGDPHFWLDPNNVIKYVENIRDGLSQANPEGAATYAANAMAYIAKLKELDRWIADQVRQIPLERRRLVTNHESLGYFADRYGFQIVGTIVPSVSTDSSPSAQQLAQLIDRIKAMQVRAIFLETGANPQLAKQIVQEAGVKVVIELYTHSITDAGGAAPTYIDMMKYNVKAIVEALVH
jgi:ABC-type Zn uptake system ZnuABC Zn-binding protein ZnuA